MIKYFNQSPLWKYLMHKGSSMSPVSKENMILINKNLTKGFLASNLYKSGYEKIYFQNIASKAGLESYDLDRIKATFQQPNLKLTGLERYQRALPTLYINSIYKKGQQYYENLHNLSKIRTLDIIDLCILINQKSKPQCFQFLLKNVKNLVIPDFLIYHIQQLLREKVHQVSSKTIEDFIKSFQQKHINVETLVVVLRTKNLREGNITKKTTKKLQNYHDISQIISILDGMQHKIIYNSLFNHQNLQIFKSWLQQIQQGISLNQNTQLEILIRILRKIQAQILLLPKRNILKDKVSDEQKALKLKLFQNEKYIKILIIGKIGKDLTSANDQKLLELINKIQSFCLLDQSLNLNYYKQSLIKKVTSNPILYTNYPQIFIKAVQMAIILNINRDQIINLIHTHINQLNCSMQLLRLINVFKKYKKDYKSLEMRIRNIGIDDGIDVSIKKYLQHTDILNSCQNIRIQMGNIIQLIGYLKTNKIPKNLKILQDDDQNNILSLWNILQFLKVQPIIQEDRISVNQNKEKFVITKTKLFRPLFDEIQKQTMSDLNQNPTKKLQVQKKIPKKNSKQNMPQIQTMTKNNSTFQQQKSDSSEQQLKN